MSDLLPCIVFSTLVFRVTRSDLVTPSGCSELHVPCTLVVTHWPFIHELIVAPFDGLLHAWVPANIALKFFHAHIALPHSEVVLVGVTGGDVTRRRIILGTQQVRNAQGCPGLDAGDLPLIIRSVHPFRPHALQITGVARFALPVFVVVLKYRLPPICVLFS